MIKSDDGWFATGRTPLAMDVHFNIAVLLFVKCYGGCRSSDRRCFPQTRALLYRERLFSVRLKGIERQLCQRIADHRIGVQNLQLYVFDITENRMFSISNYVMVGGQ